MNSIEGQSYGFNCGGIPNNDWLNTQIHGRTQQVNLNGRHVEVASSSFVAVASDCSQAYPSSCPIEAFVNNRCDAQRRHLDRDIDLWLQAYDAGSYNPVVQSAFRATVR